MRKSKNIQIYVAIYTILNKGFASLANKKMLDRMVR